MHLPGVQGVRVKITKLEFLRIARWRFGWRQGGGEGDPNFTTAPTANPITYTLTSLGGNGLPAQVVFSSGVCSTLPMLSGVHTQTCNVRWQARSVMNDAPGNSLAYFLETVAASYARRTGQHGGAALDQRDDAQLAQPRRDPISDPERGGHRDAAPGAKRHDGFRLDTRRRHAGDRRQSGLARLHVGAGRCGALGHGQRTSITLGNMPANSGFSFTYNRAMPAGTPINVDREMMLQLSGSYMRGNPGDPNTSPSCVLPVPNPDTFVLGPGSISTDSVLANDPLLTQVLRPRRATSPCRPSAPFASGRLHPLDANGFITVAPGTTPGIYDYIYQICVPASGAETAPVCRSVKDSVTVVSLDPQRTHSACRRSLAEPLRAWSPMIKRAGCRP